MGTLTLFDSNCFIGFNSVSQPGAYHDVEGLLKIMDRMGIAESLVTHNLAVSYDWAEGNAALSVSIAGIPRLHPCWVIMPDHLHNDEPSTVKKMIELGIHSVRLFPKRIGPLRSWNCGRLLVALERYSLPVFVDFELDHYREHLSAIDWDGLNWALGEFPHLPLILVRVGQALDRILFPLLERHKNLHLETSYYIGAGAIERICTRCGAERLLFGTGMARYAPGPAITLLTYSELTKEEQQKIGGENMRRLLGAVKASV